jgi:phospholipid transport system substrate-binding protein
MMPAPRFVVVGVAVLVALLVARTTAGAADEPAQQLRRNIDRVFVALGDSRLSPADRQASVRRIAQESFDFEETARQALGRHWAARTAAERAEFVRLFTDLMERAYLSKMETYDGEQVEILGETVDGGEAVVRSRVLTRQAAEIPVDYRMRRGADERWRVYDVHVAGVSLVANYRAQFNKIIRTSSYDTLVDRLRAKEAATARRD